MIAAPPERTLTDTFLASLIAGLNPDGGSTGPDTLPLDLWLRSYFPGATRARMGRRHERLWTWIEGLTPGIKPRSRVEVWPRGGGKSTSVELGVTRAGRKHTRRFALYISATQDQADKHVQSIAARFEAIGVGRAVNKYGQSKGWKMDLLRTEDGFNVLAVGIDTASRGVKLEDFRPDWMIFDDIDGRHDSEGTTLRKIETITESILPAGSPDCAVLFVQNRIHGDSIVSQLADGTADFLLDREVYEEPAVEGLELASEEQPDGTRRYRIAAGRATWEGQSLDVCEAQLNTWGRAAFLREAQHETDESEDGLWQRGRDIDPFRTPGNEVPPLYRIVVAVDPNTTGTGDEAGIVVAGIAKYAGTVHGYVLEDATTPGGPKAWAQAAVDAYHRWQADTLVAESNNGGEMVAITIGTIPKAPRVDLIHASRGKQTRAQPVQKLYEDGRVHHAGVFVALERELVTWRPGDPSPNRLDSAVWAITELMLGHHTTPWALAL